MEEKYCKICQQNHPLTDEFWFFSKKPNGRDVIQCKATKKKRIAEYSAKNRERLLEKQRAAYRLNPEKAKEKRERSADKTKAYLKEYRNKPENKAKLRATNSRWKEANAGYIKEKSRDYYQKTKHTRKKEAPEKVRARVYRRYHSEPEFRVKVNLRNRFRNALNGVFKTGSAVRDLGMSIADFLVYMETKFHPHPVTGEAMTWENQGEGGWDIDHIKPCAAFDLTDPEQQKRLCHYTNLQPMWAGPNRRKSDRVKKKPDVRSILLNAGFSPVMIQSCPPVFGMTNGVTDLYIRSVPLATGEKSSFEIRKDFESRGYRILQFYPGEFFGKTDIILSMVKNFFGQSKKVYARDCEIRPIKSSDAAEFLNKNHIMGHMVASKYFGLYYGLELVSVMGFKRHGPGIEITRSASKIGYSVTGGFSKLINFLEGNVLVDGAKPKYILSFCDLRYGNGQSYEKCGFALEGVTEGFNWSDGYETFNRQYCKANMDARLLPESKYAEEMGLFKIIDAGQAKYMKTLE